MWLLLLRFACSRQCGSDCNNVLFSDLDAHQALSFAIPVAFFFGFALVVLLLALRQPDFNLDPSLLKM